MGKAVSLRSDQYTFRSEERDPILFSLQNKYTAWYFNIIQHFDRTLAQKYRHKYNSYLRHKYNSKHRHKCKSWYWHKYKSRYRHTDTNKVLSTHTHSNPGIDKNAIHGTDTNTILGTAQILLITCWHAAHLQTQPAQLPGQQWQRQKPEAGGRQWRLPPGQGFRPLQDLLAKWVNDYHAALFQIRRPDHPGLVILILPLEPLSEVYPTPSLLVIPIPQINTVLHFSSLQSCSKTLVTLYSILHLYPVDSSKMQYQSQKLNSWCSLFKYIKPWCLYLRCP